MNVPSGEHLRSGDGWPGNARLITLDGVQGDADELAAESGPRPASGLGAEADTNPLEPPPGQSQDSPSVAADSGTEDAGTSGQSPEVQQADDAPEEETTEFTSAEQEQLVKNWPTLDKEDSDVSSRARRWPLGLVILALVGGGSLFATRIHATKSRSLESPRSAPLVAIAPTAPVQPASEGNQGMAAQAGSPTVDQMAGLQPTTGQVAAEKQVGLPAEAEAKPEHTVEPEPGSPPQAASGETPSRAPEADQADPAPAVPPEAEGLGERCRKADARGKGRPAAVMAACRAAIAAEPEASDIMVILARVQLDLGRPGEARSWAKKALQGKRDLPDAYVFLGGAEQEMGRPAEAKAAYKKYLQLAPTGSHASELRAVLDRM